MKPSAGLSAGKSNADRAATTDETSRVWNRISHLAIAGRAGAASGPTTVLEARPWQKFPPGGDAADVSRRSGRFVGHVIPAPPLQRRLRLVVPAAPRLLNALTGRIPRRQRTEVK